MSGDEAAPAQGAQTAELPVLRDAHLQELEFVEFAQGLMEPDERHAALRHLDACPVCRATLEALHRENAEGATRLSDPLLGRMLGDYKVEQALARGGMGVVYRGEHPLIGKKVAIKVLLPETADDPSHMHRLLAEARAVNTIRHPNIIDIFSFGELPGGRHYFVMELLDGLPLNELQAQKGRFSPLEVATVLEQACGALAAAHGAGVIHRDLKPANLFVTTLPDGSWHVTVLDFGLAKQLGSSSKTAVNVVMGTPGFMAPEQIRGHQATARSDLYAMGVVAWVLLAGEEPFDSPSFMDLLRLHLEAPLPSLAEKVPGCPPGLVRLVERLLSKAPEDRPQSAAEVVTELRALKRTWEQAEAPPAPRTSKDPRRNEPTKVITRPVKGAPPPAPAPATPAGNRALLVALGATIALVLLGLGTLALPKPRPVEPAPELPEVVQPQPPAPRPPPEVVVTPPKVEAPEAPVEPVEPKRPQPVRPAALTQASVEKRLDEARRKSARLESAAARRMMNLDLDRLEKQLKGGAAPRQINTELSEVLDNYGAP